MSVPMQSLEQIASCVAGYDPDALPVEQAREFIARLVTPVMNKLLAPAVDARPVAA